MVVQQLIPAAKGAPALGAVAGSARWRTLTHRVKAATRSPGRQSCISLRVCLWTSTSAGFYDYAMSQRFGAFCVCLCLKSVLTNKRDTAYSRFTAGQ